MKKKFAIINLSLMLAVLFSILFQSVHSYEHFLGQETTFVNHSDNDGTTKIQTLDHNHEKCFVCEFTLSSFIATEFTSFKSQLTFEAFTQTNFPATETPDAFSGSLFSHRGPPSNC